MSGIVEIIVAIYSGRLDPTIDLSMEEIDELRRRLQIARQQPLAERSQLPQFGYRGFVLRNDAREGGLPFRANIFGGVVAITEERPEGDQKRHSEPRLFSDAGRLEDWLLERAAERGLSRDIEAMGGPSEKRDSETGY